MESKISGSSVEQRAVDICGWLAISCLRFVAGRHFVKLDNTSFREFIYRYLLCYKLGPT